jgi:hypothetical protein
LEANTYSKYALRDLHESIGLLDRKINHCQALEAFDSQEVREATLRKLASKRASLVKAALALTASGVGFDPKFLPRSLVQPVENAGEATALELGAGPGAERKQRARK